MPTPNYHTTCSGIARFFDTSARDRFVQFVLDQDADLRSHCFLPETRPAIVFDNLTPRQCDRVIAPLQGLGEWFEDIQFRTMGQGT